MLTCVRWYVAYPLSLRHIEGMMQERAVDREDDTVDFLLFVKPDMAAARRFQERAINLHDVPEKTAIDKSGANTAAM